MYAVVGCDECSHLWIVEGEPGTSGCPRCGRTRSHDKRKKFLTTDDEDHAREYRSAMLAQRQGEEEAFADLDSFSELEERVEDPVVDDEQYLESGEVDPASVAEAGERATGKSGGSTSDPEVVREAVVSLESPTRERVTGYAADRGVDPEKARRVLDRLAERGELVEDGGQYRLL